jgi:transcriptional regulator GlxA family with amidase domain
MLNAIPTPTTADPRVQQIVARIQADPAHAYQWDQVAAEVHLTRRQLERLFQLELHATPHQFLLTQRLEKACDLLVTSFRLVKEIAEAVGLPDVNHFIRAFKKQYGQTPNAYRRQATLEKNARDVANE